MTSGTIYVMDVDDTIILHTKVIHDIYNMNNDTELLDMINSLDSQGFYLYTNGTYSHGHNVSENLQLNDITNTIFARDTIPYMKPHIESFNYVNNQITDYKRNDYKIIFFDDLIENLVSARKVGWKTVWISNNFLKKPDFVDYSFPNIYDALIYFKLKER